MVRTRSDQRRWCQNQRSSRPIRLKCTSVASRWLQERQRATGYAAAAPGRRAPAGPKPRVFGAGKNRGLRLKPGKLELEVVTLGEAGVTPDDVLVHEETNRALATLSWWGSSHRPSRWRSACSTAIPPRRLRPRRTPRPPPP